MTRTRVYIGGLAKEVRERDVERFFDGYGRIVDITLKDGYGFAEFTDERDADDAIHELDGRRLLGTRITVQNSRKPRWKQQHRDAYRSPKHRFSPARRTKFQVAVENLSSRVQWQDLKDFLTKVGKVTYAKAHNEHSNEGMVEFATYEDMKRVIRELDGAELKGRNIKITETKRFRSESRSPTPRSESRSPTPRSESRSPTPRSKSRTKSRSPSVQKSNSPSQLEKIDGEKKRATREEVNKSEVAETDNSNFETDFQSMEASRKRSREDSEDDSRKSFKRSKSSDSGSKSPCND